MGTGWEWVGGREGAVEGGGRRPSLPSGQERRSVSDTFGSPRHEGREKSELLFAFSGVGTGQIWRLFSQQAFTEEAPVCGASREWRGGI